MKLAVIKTGGKQYLVAPGDVLMVEKLSETTGEEVAFKDILLIDDGGKTIIGTPAVPKTAVRAEVVAAGKSPKVVVVKYKSKTRYRVKRGHRQPFTKVKIVTIDSEARS